MLSKKTFLGSRLQVLALARTWLATLAIVTLSINALADSKSTNQEETDASSAGDIEKENQDEQHSDSSLSIEEVKVVAHPLSSAGLRAIGNIDVVSIEYNNLDRVRVENLADVIATVPGARSASYGPGAAHPVIHGMDGPRILVLYDRLRPMDVATYPGDHIHLWSIPFSLLRLKS